MGRVMCRLFYFLEDVSSSQNSLILCLTGIDRFLTVVGTKRSTKVSAAFLRRKLNIKL